MEKTFIFSVETKKGEGRRQVGKGKGWNFSPKKQLLLERPE